MATDKSCRFCCKAPDAKTRLANGTVNVPISEPVEVRYGEVFKKYPPRTQHHVMSSIGDDNMSTPTVIRDRKIYQVYRWKCDNIIGQECCSCCRPEDALLPHELSETETKQMVDGIIITVE